MGGGNWKKDKHGNWNKYKAVADDAESDSFEDSADRIILPGELSGPHGPLPENSANAEDEDVDVDDVVYWGEFRAKEDDETWEEYGMAKGEYYRNKYGESSNGMAETASDIDSDTDYYDEDTDTDDEFRPKYDDERWEDYGRAIRDYYRNKYADYAMADDVDSISYSDDDDYSSEYDDDVYYAQRGGDKKDEYKKKWDDNKDSWKKKWDNNKDSWKKDWEKNKGKYDDTKKKYAKEWDDKKNEYKKKYNAMQGDEIVVSDSDSSDDDDVSDDAIGDPLPLNSGHNDKGKHDKYDSRDSEYWKKNGDWKKDGKHSKDYDDHWNKHGGSPWKKHDDDWYQYDSSYWRKDGQWKKHGKHSKEYDNYWKNKGGNWKKDKHGNWNKYKAMADDAESDSYSDDSSDDYDEIQIPKMENDDDESV